MKKNMGSADRIIRVLIVLAIAGLYYTGILTGMVATILLVVAGVFLLTAFMSICPLYMPFGISTCSKKK